MEKLSQLAKKKYIKLLVYGDSGSGKTCFAAGFPTPILYLDFDGKINSAAKFFEQDQERLDKITVVDLRASMTKDTISEFIKAVKIIPKDTYKTIVLDSITTFSAACIKHIIKINPGITRVVNKTGLKAKGLDGFCDNPVLQDYGILKREFLRIIPGLLGISTNIVMCAHIKVDKDEATGEITRGTMMDGSFGQELPIYFDEVYHAHLDGKGNYMAQTKSNYKFKCRTSLSNLPETIPLKYEEIKKYL